MNEEQKKNQMSVHLANITKTFHKSFGSNKKIISNKDSDNLRKNYLSFCKECEQQNPNLIKSTCNSVNNDELKKYFKEQINIMGEAVVKYYKKSNIHINNHNDNNKYENELKIGYNDQIHDFSNISVISIGRYTACDVVLKEDNTSRIHCLIFCIGDQLAVVDVGSAAGIVTIMRSSNEFCDKSLPGNRKILTFNINESVTLSLDNVKITINPRECIICMNKQRKITFNCGHYLTCYECSLKLTKCPTCNRYISHRKESIKMMTYFENNK